jgi:nucleoside-triphosphatase THEP1
MAITKLILWTGEKHSGKTTSAFKLVEFVRNGGFTVAGLLAPSIYEDDQLVGFDAFDLQSGKRVPLSRRRKKGNEGGERYLAPQFTGGLIFGHTLLSCTATKTADLIIVDEFGPLELDQRGWRKDVDLLLASRNAVIMLIVRRGLVDLVKQLYKNVPCIELAAGEPDSVERIVTILKDR